MKTIKIHGTIGGCSWWNEEFFTAKSVQEQLDGLEAGEEIEVTVNSVGGSVYEGIVIFNLLRDAAKTHPVFVRVIGVAMSMASYIMLAARSVNRDAKLTVSDNSVVMIHNPWTVAGGDYREMAKEAEYLEKLSVLYGAVHATVSGLSLEVVRKAMDDETYYVGREIVDAGFANDFEPIADDDDGDDSDVAARHQVLTAKAQERFERFTKTALEKTPARADWQRIAALLNEKPFKGAGSPVAINGLRKNNLSADSSAGSVSGPSGARGEPSFPKGGIMSPEDLQAKDKACYVAVFERGAAEGAKSAVEQERLRVAVHIKMGRKVGNMELAVKFIENGKSASDEDVNDAYFEAALAKSCLDARQADDPPPLNLAGGADDDAVAKAFTLGAQGKGIGGKTWRE
ncbi:MAG: Clp protease ClpP [Treponema sp.]|jgi:ATP-dependent protease ClpP protease subunit|nr:Clp protease ClpP [Treponema sp.]